MHAKALAAPANGHAAPLGYGAPLPPPPPARPPGGPPASAYDSPVAKVPPVQGMQGEAGPGSPAWMLEDEIGKLMEAKVSDSGVTPRVTFY